LYYLRLGDHELGVLQIRHAEVRDGPLRFLRELETRHVVVDRFVSSYQTPPNWSVGFWMWTSWPLTSS
jgi:hypothetical protein